MSNEANLNPRITQKITIDGTPYLAVDGRGMFWSWRLYGRPFGTKTWRLYAQLEGDRIVFTGGFGTHSIAAEAAISSPERVEAHWRGYVKETNDRLCGRT